MEHWESQRGQTCRCPADKLIYPWAWTSRPIEEKDLNTHKEYAEPVKQHLGYRSGNSQSTIGYTARGTSKDYWYEKYGSVAYTFEGNGRSESGKFDKHELFWNDYFNKISATITNPPDQTVVTRKVYLAIHKVSAAGGIVAAESVQFISRS